MAIAIIGPKFYAWDRNGLPLAFGKVFTYQARTNTPKATYQSEDQVVENANPVILNGEGYADIYLDGSYKIVVKDSDDNEIWTSDPVTANQATEWNDCVSATYISSTSFSVAGDKTSQYEVGRRVRIDNNVSDYSYSTIKTSVLSGQNTTITVTDAVVQTGVVGVCRSIIGPESGARSISDTQNEAKTYPYISGDVFQTRGKDTAGDGLGTWYLVKTASEATADGDTIDGVDNFTLNNGNVAIRHSAGGAKGGVGAVNIVHGYSGNSIAQGPVVRANVIGGGGYVGNINHIDGYETRYATISGGYDNYINGVASTEDIDGAASTISGGAHHEIQSTHATIGGGSYGLIKTNAPYSGIFSGTQNTINDNASSSVISGGNNNQINSPGATIAGGTGHTITGDNGTIGGGSSNTIVSGNNNTIVGGVNNTADGGNAVVLGGTTNSATAQGAMAMGRAAVASARGALCITTDTAVNPGYTNNLAYTAAFKFDEGFRFLGNKTITVPADNNGGMEEILLETTATITASSSVNFADTIPTNSVILGCQIRVNSSLAENFDVNYTGGATQNIATNLPFAINTKTNKWFDMNANTPITSGGVTNVTLTPNGGGSFTAQGEVYAQIRYLKFRNTDSV